ncbi:uncharacterized protein HNQ77_002118 [Silvibacterium bohemicum]|uniref:HD domain-containing protein n=1 Tax=Silvibacterium bohemicum TaxID=1577686 RepID=A0A841JS79_9BACT|nr:HD domain-containing protein [Silvibacterium bohemicum]MBB6144166.1 uncharacterized protein [Silvibacterium bohemicum]
MSKLTSCVKSEVLKRVSNSEQSVAHRFDHIERVMHNALKIAATIQGVDYELLELAVLLHDVDQPTGRKAEHVELSLLAAEEILRQAGCPNDRASDVLTVIAEHSSEHVRTIKPSTDEARVLFDADKLDGLAAVGIARVFSMFGQMGLAPFEAIEWYKRKIEIASEYVQTDEGRRLFALRLPYVQQFLSEMESEAGDVADIWKSGKFDSYAALPPPTFSSGSEV